MEYFVKLIYRMYEREYSKENIGFSEMLDNLETIFPAEHISEPVQQCLYWPIDPTKEASFLNNGINVYKSFLKPNICIIQSIIQIKLLEPLSDYEALVNDIIQTCGNVFSSIEYLQIYSSDIQAV